MEEKTKEVKKPLFELTDEYDLDAITLDWSELEEEVLDKIPAELLINRPAVEDDGTLVERTVIYICPVKKLDKNWEKLENNGIIIGIPK